MAEVAIVHARWESKAEHVHWNAVLEGVRIGDGSKVGRASMFESANRGEV